MDNAGAKSETDSKHKQRCSFIDHKVTGKQKWYLIYQTIVDSLRPTSFINFFSIGQFV